MTAHAAPIDAVPIPPLDSLNDWIRALRAAHQPLPLPVPPPFTSSIASALRFLEHLRSAAYGIPSEDADEQPFDITGSPLPPATP